jgi:ligand-binding sensor domain-containing protein
MSSYLKPMMGLIFLFSLLNACINKTQANAVQDLSIETQQDSLVPTNLLKFKSGIRAIFEDSKGNLWFGSHEEGVCRFDGKSFEYFTTEDGLAHNQVRSIQEDEYGTIWFGTANGVSSYSEGTIRTHSPFFNAVLLTTWRYIDQDLWFNAGNKAGVYNYDGQKLNYLIFPKLKAHFDNVYHVTAFAKGKNNMLWIATYAGVLGYNGLDLVVINNESLGFNQKTGFLHVRSILEDSKGRLWIGNNGIGVLLKEGENIINYSELLNLSHPESIRSGAKSPEGTLEHVFAITEDHLGNIWFGDRDTGAWKYDGKKMINYKLDAKLASPMIWTIYEDHNKNLLFGMAEGGVYQFDGEYFERKY